MSIIKQQKSGTLIFWILAIILCLAWTMLPEAGNNNADCYFKWFGRLGDYGMINRVFKYVLFAGIFLLVTLRNEKNRLIQGLVIGVLALPVAYELVLFLCAKN